MTGLREARAAVLRRYVGHGLADNLPLWLPQLLDDLERIDQQHVPDGIIKFDIDEAGPLTDEEAAVFAKQWMEDFNGAPPPVVMPSEPRPPSDAEITAWIEANPEKFAAWVRRQNRINGAPPPFDAPAAKPPARRRTARKET